MSSGTSKRYAASRWTAALVVAGVLVQGFGLAALARAQGSGSDKGLEGGWRVLVTVLDCGTGLPLRPAFPAVFTFAKGGAVTGITGGQPPSLFTPQLGVWRHTQGHHYTAVTDTFVFNPAGAPIQIHRLMRAILVSDDGDSFTDQIALQVLDPAGNPFLDPAGNPVPTGCGMTVGHRME
jgi:hypothetical protein